MNTCKKVYCGVDVSKKKLDAFIHGKVKTFENNVKGVKTLKKYAGDVHYVFESTGGYERLAAWSLMREGHSVSIVNPARVRDYAKSMGQLAKTDSIDAMMITQYADTKKPKTSSLPSEAQRKLTALVTRRQHIKDFILSESNRLETAGEPFLREEIGEHLCLLKVKLKSINKMIRETINSHDQMREIAAKITNIKGLGIISAATILAYLPEIGTLSRREVAALVGLAPYCRDSGSFRGYRHISGGRKHIRACLYMASMSAIRHNTELIAFYRRLVDKNHRPKKVALVAVMRKLVIAANSEVKKSNLTLAA